MLLLFRSYLFSNPRLKEKGFIGKERIAWDQLISRIGVFTSSIVLPLDTAVSKVSSEDWDGKFSTSSLLKLN